MHFPVNEKKAADAVARLLEKSGGEADYLRIVKLAYLSDRDAIIRRGVPIVGGHYYSMRSGPTISEVMSFANRAKASLKWKDAIAPRKGNTLRILQVPNFSSLAASEIDILDAVVEEHAGRSTSQLVKWCHHYCTEYEHVYWGRKTIEVESMLRAGGKTAEKIHRVVQDGLELAELDALLA